METDRAKQCGKFSTLGVRQMPIFSKRHYEAIAKAMKAHKPDRFGDGSMPAQWKSDVFGLAALFSEDNPKFKPMQFYTACGIMEDDGYIPHKPK